MRKRTIAVLLALTIGAIAAIPVFAATPKVTAWLASQTTHLRESA